MKLSDLHVEAAIEAAPVTPFPAITPHLLALLRRRFVWRPYDWLHGGAFFDDPWPRRRRLRLPSFLFPFALDEKVVWWLGDSAERCAVGQLTADRLVRGRAQPDGTLRVDGARWRMDFVKGEPNRARLMRLR